MTIKSRARMIQQGWFFLSTLIHKETFPCTPPLLLSRHLSGPHELDCIWKICSLLVGEPFPYIIFTIRFGLGCPRPQPKPNLFLISIDTSRPKTNLYLRKPNPKIGLPVELNLVQAAPLVSNVHCQCEHYMCGPFWLISAECYQTKCGKD